MKKINWQYTFGEILIVIIGITIAFSLNKCTESKKNSALKNQYLIHLIQDVKADKQHLSDNLEALHEKLAELKRIIPALKPENSQDPAIVPRVFNVSRLINFTPKNITYQTLINSGDFKLIDNFELKRAIEEYYAKHTALLQAYSRQENIHKTYLGNYFVTHMNYDAFQENENPFENQRLLKNILHSMLGSVQLKINVTKQGIEDCDRLLKLLEIPY